MKVVFERVDDDLALRRVRTEAFRQVDQYGRLLLFFQKIRHQIHGDFRARNVARRILGNPVDYFVAVSKYFSAHCRSMHDTSIAYRKALRYALFFIPLCLFSHFRRSAPPWDEGDAHRLRGFLQGV